MQIILGNSDGMQLKCLLINEHVLALLAFRLADTSKDVIAELTIIAANIAELKTMRFYGDSGFSVKKSTSFADGIIDKINKLEQELLSNETGPETT